MPLFILLCLIYLPFIQSIGILISGLALVTILHTIAYYMDPTPTPTPVLQADIKVVEHLPDEHSQEIYLLQSDNDLQLAYVNLDNQYEVHTLTGAEINELQSINTEQALTVNQKHYAMQLAVRKGYEFCFNQGEYDKYITQMRCGA